MNNELRHLINNQCANRQCFLYIGCLSLFISKLFIGTLFIVYWHIAYCLLFKFFLAELMILVNSFSISLICANKISLNG